MPLEKIEKVLLPRLGNYWPRKDSVPGTEFPRLSAFFLLPFLRSERGF